MAAVESEADDKFSSVDVESILSRAGRRPLTFAKTRSLYRAPEFEKRLSGEETAEEGTTVHFETKVNGFPQPVVKWYKEVEQIVDHPRIHVDYKGDGIHTFTLENANKGDAASYRCRAENEEGSASCLFYLHVKGKPRSPKRSKGPTKRSVSYPPMFPTIVEKVEEEEKEGKETARSPPSPLTQLYDGLTLQTRNTWPKFLGDWAYVDTAHRNGGSLESDTDSENVDSRWLEVAEHDDDVFSDESSDQLHVGGQDQLRDDRKGPVSFYLDSNEAVPQSQPCQNGNVHIHQNGSVPAHAQISGKNELNNNQRIGSKTRQGMTLPLSESLSSKLDISETAKEKVKSKKSGKVSNVKTNDKTKESLKTAKYANGSKNRSNKDNTKTTESKDGTPIKVDRRGKLPQKDTKRLNSKEEDDTPRPRSHTSRSCDKTGKHAEKKLEKSIEHSSGKHETIQMSDLLSDRNTPILGTARPLVFSTVASKTTQFSNVTYKDGHSLDNSKTDNGPHDTAGNSGEQSGKGTHFARSRDKEDPLLGPPQIVNVPFGRFFEESVFVVCFFTFLALCIGIPTETFVLVVLGMHFVYSMATILGLC